MMAWRLSEVVRYAAGQIVGNDCAFSSVSTDSRTLKPGALFVALSGPASTGTTSSPPPKSTARPLRSSSDRWLRRFRSS